MYNALICNKNTSHPCKGKEINLGKLNPYIVCGESTPAESKLIHRRFCEYNFAVFLLPVGNYSKCWLMLLFLSAVNL